MKTYSTVGPPGAVAAAPNENSTPPTAAPKNADTRSTRVFGVAAVSAFFGAAVGGVLFSFGAAATAPGGPTVKYVFTGLYAALDALLFGLLVVGGYAPTLTPAR